MKFAICNETYGAAWSFERVCDDVAACGYDGIEIAPNTLDPDPRNLTDGHARAVGEMARRAGLEVVALHWLLKGREDLHINTPDLRVRRATVAYLTHLADLCAAMGGTILVLGSPQQRNVVDGDAYEDAFERARDTCRSVAEVAASLGVTLALEPLAPAYTNFLTSAAEAERLVEAVGHPACQLHLDAFALSSETEPIEHVIGEHGNNLAHFHANDTSMGGPGTGDIDFVKIARALAHVRYEGYVSVEVFDYALGGPRIARDSLAFLRSIPGWG